MLNSNYLYDVNLKVFKINTLFDKREFFKRWL